MAGGEAALVLEVEWSRTMAPLWMRGISLEKASSQVGCRMGCAFCASTVEGKVRDLTPAEMLDQVLFTQLDSGLEISNIVLMGIGEPMDNLDTVLRFLDIT